jgi:hypothetical protein
MRSGGVVLSLISGFIDISFLFRRRVDSAIAGLEEAKNLAGKAGRVLHLIKIGFSDAEFGRNLAKPSKQFAATVNH